MTKDELNDLVQQQDEVQRRILEVFSWLHPGFHVYDVHGLLINQFAAELKILVRTRWILDGEVTFDVPAEVFTTDDWRRWYATNALAEGFARIGKGVE